MKKEMIEKAEVTMEIANGIFRALEEAIEKIETFTGKVEEGKGVKGIEIIDLFKDTFESFEWILSHNEAKVTVEDERVYKVKILEEYSIEKMLKLTTFSLREFVKTEEDEEVDALVEFFLTEGSSIIDDVADELLKVVRRCYEIISIELD